MEARKSSILSGIAFGIITGIFIAILADIRFGLIAAPINGLAFGALIYLFLTSKIVNQQTKLDAKVGEQVIYSGGANHFRNIEAVGGKLYLLPDKLEFKSHNFNIQNHSLIIDLNNIKGMRFYNILWIIPTGLEIIMTDGHKEKFVVNSRKKWRKEIEIILNKHK